MLTSRSCLKVVLCKGSFATVDGSGQILVNYALWLRRRGHQPRVLLAKPPSNNNSHYRSLESENVTVDSVIGHPIYYLLRVLRKINVAWAELGVGSVGIDWSDIAFWTSWFYFRRHRPDIIHLIQADASAPVMIRAASAAGIPVIYQEMITPRYGPESHECFDQLSKVLPLCSAVTALSPIQAIEVCERIPYDGSVSILPLITNDPVELDASVRRSVDDEISFGFAARLEHWKGPLVLLDAFAEVLRHFPKAYLRVAGTGPQEQEVFTRARDLGISNRCDFIGAYSGSEGRHAFMQSLDVFVQPSLADGTPNSVIEAMAYGLPIVASSNGGIPDLVSAKSGILVPPGDAATLAKAMIRLAGDRCLRIEMGRNSRKRYEELFSPEAVLPLLLKTYQWAIAKSKGHTVSILKELDTISHPWARRLTMGGGMETATSVSRSI